MICIETVKKYCNGDVFKIENYKETKRILSENHKGICKNKHWFNNGKIEVMDYTMPEGFSKGRLYHARTGVEK